MTNRSKFLKPSLIQPVSQQMFDEFFASTARQCGRAATCDKRAPSVLDTAEIWRCASADHRLLHVLQILNSYDSRTSSCNEETDAAANRCFLGDHHEGPCARHSTSFTHRREQLHIGGHRRASTTSAEHQCPTMRIRSGRSCAGSIPSIFTDELELLRMFSDAQRSGHVVRTDGYVC